MDINKEFILEPTDDWLIAKTLETFHDDNYIYFGEFIKKHDVVIKVLSPDNIEYKIYKILLKFKSNIPNLPFIYGAYSCYESSKNLSEIIKQFEEKNNKIVNKGICQLNPGVDNDKIKIEFIVMERITNSSTVVELLKCTILHNDLFLSILMQGLYQIYQLYYIFGIVINDYNASNILLQRTNDMSIEYKISYNPYRYYKEEYRCIPYNDTWDKTTNIKLYGLKIYLIDFDNARIVHDRFRNNPKSNIITNITQQIFSFFDNILLYASKNIKDKFQDIYKQKEFLIICCNHSIKDYNNSTKTWIDNSHFIYKTSKCINSMINRIVKLFNLPNDYMIY